MDTVGIGIIGVGAMGSGHMKNMMKIPGLRIAAVCDVVPERVDKAVEESGAKGYDDYRKLLDDTEVDAAVIVTPNYLHAPMAIDSFDAGKDVFLEKPISMNADEAREILAAKEKSGKKCQVGVVVRFWGGPQALKPRVEAGELGRIYYARASYLRRRGIPGMGSWFTQKKYAGGGPSADLAIHVLDTTMWLMDNFKPVSAFGSTFAEFGPKGVGGSDWGDTVKDGSFDVEDLATALVKFEDGATVHLETSWAANCAKGTFDSTLFGDKAGADMSPCTLYYTDEKGKDVNQELEVSAADGYFVEFEHFAECLVEDKEPMPKLEQAVVVQAVLDAVRKSAEIGESVKVEW